jgi:hypothetical protein
VQPSTESSLPAHRLVVGVLRKCSASSPTCRNRSLKRFTEVQRLVAHLPPTSPLSEPLPCQFTQTFYGSAAPQTMNPLLTPLPSSLSAGLTAASPERANGMAAEQAGQMAEMRLVPPLRAPTLAEAVLCVSVKRSGSGRQP